MAGTAAKILGGCGIGCLLAAVLLVGMGWMGYRWAEDIAETVDQAEDVGRQLEEAFPGVRDFVPVAAPGPPADRLEIFVAVREALAGPRRDLALAIAGMAPKEGAGGVATGLNVARAGFGLAPRAIEFVRSRNQALLEHGMGLGEYTWFYWLGYHAWLGHPAGDSLLDELFEEHRRGDGSVHFQMDGGLEPERLTWELRSDVTAMLDNLAAELEGDSSRAAIRELVTAELDRLGSDPARVPFEDGLPEALAEGLEPYRVRLEASYSRATNPFELRGFD
jgi:hypothetical protein